MSTNCQNLPVRRREITPRSARLLRIEFVVVGSVAIGAFVFAALVLLSPGDPWIMGRNPYVSFAFPVYFSLRGAMFTARMRRKLGRHDGMLCPECEHDLRGLEDDPLTCPECGRRWTVERVRGSWAQIRSPLEKLMRRKSPAQRG